MPCRPSVKLSESIARCRTSIAVLLLLAGCAGGTENAQEASENLIKANNAHVPDFASKPYEPFSREAVVAIALREWRAWGQLVDDDPPNTRPEPPPEDKPERMEGMWQRVGEYWFLGQNATRAESGWTGRHDDFGTQFPAQIDGEYAWSAAFISYVMRTAGAGSRFPYSPSHSTYINAAARRNPGLAITAEPLDGYAPQLGDIICFSRGRRLRFRDLPAGAFPAHCEFVVGLAPGILTSVGGNVDDAVTMRHVPINASGMLADPGGRVIDPNWPWFVVLKVAYDR